MTQETQQTQLPAAPVSIGTGSRVPAVLRKLQEAAERNQRHADPTAMHVVIQIGSKGEVEQQVKNGDGVNCLALTEKIEAARGGVNFRKMEAGCDDGRDRRTRRTTNDRQRV